MAGGSVNSSLARFVNNLASSFQTYQVATSRKYDRASTLEMEDWPMIDGHRTGGLIDGVANAKIGILGGTATGDAAAAIVGVVGTGASTRETLRGKPSIATSAFTPDADGDDAPIPTGFARCSVNNFTS